MKKLIFIIAFITIIATPQSVFNNDVGHYISLSEVVEYERQQVIIESYKEFKEHLGFLESTNRYDVTSPSGTFIGKYQFGYMALEDIGMIQYYPTEFLQSPYLQEKALYKNLLKNKYYLQHTINYFEGKEINGILITKPCILAMAHLLGASSVRRYLQSGGLLDLTDGNGTKISSYCEEFTDKHFVFDDILIINIEKIHG